MKRILNELKVDYRTVKAPLFAPRVRLVIVTLPELSQQMSTISVTIRRGCGIVTLSRQPLLFESRLSHERFQRYDRRS